MPEGRPVLSGGSASGLTLPASEPRPYIMRISRLTIDKLGVKLYDNVSAVVAELVANAYDADAERVTIRVPLGTELARKGKKKGQVIDHDLGIEVVDDGHGMTPDEAIDLYLHVGVDRRIRKAQGQGPTSRVKRRPVMGRKGIGKLAPFGICRTIEVRSAGGPKTAKGYLTTHFSMRYEDIVSDSDKEVKFKPGPNDQTYSPKPGTIIRLTRFLPKRVPDRDTFVRQLARRFAVAKTDFAIEVKDLGSPQVPAVAVSRLDIPKLEGTEVDVSKNPVPYTGEKLPVKGWLALGKTAYKNEEMAGVRIYARGKLVAVTRDFEQPAGFTGEFTMRSYLVGEVHAEWLDIDDGEDLVRTDRQGILWDSDYGTALRAWGAQLIKKIAAASSAPRRERKSIAFIERSQIEARAKKRFRDTEVVTAAVTLARQIGGFSAEDELDDQDYVSDLCEVILSVAPHKALIESFQEFARSYGSDVPPLDSLVELFGKTRIAEMASYSQIAAERVRVIQQLERLVTVDTDEEKLQALLAQAPWLIETTWAIVTKNQTLKTFKAAFQDYWKRRKGKTIEIAIPDDKKSKRPDFTLIATGRQLHFVEIKASAHTFNDADFKRLLGYVDAMDTIFAEHKEFKEEFPQGYQIDLIANQEKLVDSANRRSYSQLQERRQLERKTWVDFLHRAKKSHEMFLEISAQTAKRATS
jgi:hypothetical protein